ncbi:MAG: CarD family transcriptional regulator [Alphaproteobacteria bacterium]
MKVAPPVFKAPVKAPAKAAAPAAQPTKSKAPEAPPPAPKKPEKLDFTAGDFVVYPAHGVGLVEGVETTSIAGMEITLYTICFEKDRMRLKLPVSKVKSSGLRKLSSKDRLKDALSTLQGRSQTKRVMWSRRAQEYEAKINSGDPVAIAEVLRDLRKDTGESEQSYSERQIYQAALERLAREVAAIEKIDEKKAAEKLEAVLSNVA